MLVLSCGPYARGFSPVLILPLTRCVALDKGLGLHRPWFLHLENGAENKSSS